MSRQGEYLPFVAVAVGSLLAGLPPPYGALCLFLFFWGVFLVFTGGLLLGWTRTRRLRREPPQRRLFKGPRVNLLVGKQERWFLGYVKPRSLRVAAGAFHAAMAESGERRAH